jgi:haloalkane dehalogenase
MKGYDMTGCEREQETTTRGPQPDCRFLDLPWGQVHVRHAGRGPAVVLIHQSPLSSRTYAPALPHLAAAGMAAYAPDTPGFGRSTTPGTQWTIPDYADALWQVLDALGLAQVSLLGQHTGASIAVEAARQRPERTDRLILQGLPVYEGHEAAERLASYAPPYRPARDGSHLRFIWRRVQRMYPDLDPWQASLRVLEYLEAGPDYATAYRAVFTYDLASSLPRLRVPVHLLYGSEDLVAWRQARAHRMLAGITQEVLDGLSDFAAVQAPQRFAAAVARLAHHEGPPAEQPFHGGSLDG